MARGGPLGSAFQSSTTDPQDLGLDQIPLTVHSHPTPSSPFPSPDKRRDSYVQRQRKPAQRGGGGVLCHTADELNTSSLQPLPLGREETLREGLGPSSVPLLVRDLASLQNEDFKLAPGSTGKNTASF